MSRPSLSVVIPTRDTRELTLRCLGSLAGGGVEPLEVVVVDDASTDGTAAAVRRAHPAVTVVEAPHNLGFGGAANLGVGRATGEVVLLLNSDTEVLDGALAALVGAFADDPALGIAGAELLDPDGTPQWRAGRRPTAAWLFAQASGLGAAAAALPGRGLLGRPGAARVGEVEWVSGAALAVRREVWAGCGPLDEGYRFYGQDLDLCTAARRAGWRVAVVAGCSVLHHHGATIAARPGSAGSFHPALLWSDLVRFVGKHEGPAAAARAATALRAGVRVRLAGRVLARPFVADRGGWDRASAAFRQGLEALSAAQR